MSNKQSPVKKYIIIFIICCLSACTSNKNTVRVNKHPINQLRVETLFIPTGNFHTQQLFNTSLHKFGISTVHENQSPQYQIILTSLETTLDPVEKPSLAISEPKFYQIKLTCQISIKDATTGQLKNSWTYTTSSKFLNYNNNPPIKYPEIYAAAIDNMTVNIIGHLHNLTA